MPILISKCIETYLEELGDFLRVRLQELPEVFARSYQPKVEKEKIVCCTCCLHPVMNCGITSVSKFAQALTHAAINKSAVAI